MEKVKAPKFVPSALRPLADDAAYSRVPTVPVGGAEMVQVAKLKTHPKQAGDRHAPVSLAESFAREGWRADAPPLFVSSDGYILRGHCRAEVLKLARQWPNAATLVPEGMAPAIILPYKHNDRQALAYFFDHEKADDRQPLTPGQAFLAASELWGKVTKNKEGTAAGYTGAGWDDMPLLGTEAANKWKQILGSMSGETIAALRVKAEADGVKFPSRNSLFAARKALREQAQKDAEHAAANSPAVMGAADPKAALPKVAAALMVMPDESAWTAATAATAATVGYSVKQAEKDAPGYLEAAKSPMEQGAALALLTIGRGDASLIPVLIDGIRKGRNFAELRELIAPAPVKADKAPVKADNGKPSNGKPAK